MNKVQINIVYLPGTGEPSKIYENDKGIVWNSNKYDSGKINVGMGWYSLRNPKENDCLLAIEPYCILPRDYDPDFCKNFKYVFTWTPKAFKHPDLINKIVKIKHPCWHSNFDIDEVSKKWLPWNERKNEVVFIANNKSSPHSSELYSLRLQLADLIHNRSSFEVSWYGQSDLKKPYYKGTISSKDDVLTKAKFSVCTENSYDHIYTENYFSEKMPDVWLAGCVPIYMGCYNINRFDFPEQSYIDLRTYVKKHKKVHNVDYDNLIKRIEGFEEFRYNNWVIDIKHALFRTNKLYNLVAYKEMYEKIIETLAA